MRKKVNVRDRATNKIDNRLVEHIKQLKEKIAKDISDRAIWELKVVTSQNQRLGVKRITDEPYENAPDIPLPETDKQIRKKKPNDVLSIWSQKKLCRVGVEQGTANSNQYKEQARKAEQAMNLVLRRKQMNLLDTMELVADDKYTKGHGLVRTVEKFEVKTECKVIDLEEYDKEIIKDLKRLKKEELIRFVSERYILDPEDEDDKEAIDEFIDQFKSGKKIIEVDIKRVTSYPCIEHILPENLIVPSYVTDINKAPRLTLKMWKTTAELQAMMDSGAYRKINLKEIKELKGGKKSSSDIVQQQKEAAEGIVDSTSEDDLWEIHEVCEITNLADPNDTEEESSEEYQRHIFTCLAMVDDPEKGLLQHITFPYDYEGWMYDRIDNERKDPRHYNSRGIPERNRALQEYMERAINNAFIRDEQNNTPTYEVLDTSEIMMREERFIPGEKVPVKVIGGEIRQLNQISSPDVSSNMLLQVLKGHFEESEGSTDFLFRNATNAGGGKTLGEIQQGAQMAQGPANLDVIRWAEFWGRVFTKVFYIMRERLGDSIYLPDGSEVTREDFNFPADVNANAQLEVADQQLATQKAFQRLMVIQNPVNADFVTVEDRYNAFRDWLELDGCTDPDQYSTNPMEVLQDQLTQMKQQLMQMQQMGMQLQAQNAELMKGNEKLKTSSKETVVRAQGKIEGTVQAAVEGLQDAPQESQSE